MSPKLCTGLLVLAAVVCAQYRVDPRNSYNRVICITPLVGSGTPADPKRPKYAPWPPSQDPNGIIAFTFQPTDDGQQAVVEFVARTRAAFQAILNDTTIVVFEKGKSSKGEIESAAQQHRKDFNLDTFGTVMP